MQREAAPLHSFIFCSLVFILSWFLIPYAANADQLGSGYGHSCWLKKSSNEVYCWGWNYHGEVGDGSYHSPIKPHRVALPKGEVQKLAVGGSSTCAVVDQKLYCWGANTLAQLGIEPLQDRVTPEEVPLPGQVTEVAVGSRHSCAVVEEGLMCWGFNFDCQVGLEGCIGGRENPQKFVRKPTWVTALPPQSGVSKVALGPHNTCVIKNGGVYCWGAAFDGAFGDGKSEVFYTATPQAIPGHGEGSGVREIALGNRHICANRRGMIRCWGSAAFLGIPNPGRGIRGPTPPSNITGSPWRSLSTLGQTTCAVFRGQPSCWGLGINGALGVGYDLEFAFEMMPVKGLRNVEIVATGEGHSCALNKNSEIYCWGWNSLCQMGDSSCQDGVSSVFEPRRVMF